MDILSATISAIGCWREKYAKYFYVIHNCVKYYYYRDRQRERERENAAVFFLDMIISFMPKWNKNMSLYF